MPRLRLDDPAFAAHGVAVYAECDAAHPLAHTITAVIAIAVTDGVLHDGFTVECMGVLVTVERVA